MNQTSSISADAPENYHSAGKIQEVIVNYIAEILEIEPHQVNVKAPFNQYGLDSLSSVTLISHLEHFLGSDLSPNLLYDLPSIEVLSQRLAAQNIKKPELSL